jgi:hypothetical protein
LSPLRISYFSENGHIDAIAIIAGIVQTALYLDFFYVYFTKCVTPHYASRRMLMRFVYPIEYFKAKNSSCLRENALNLSPPSNAAPIRLYLPAVERWRLV